MKRFAPLFLALGLSSLMLSACTTVEPEDPITGDPDAVVLSGSVFTVTDRTFAGSYVTFDGTVQNNSTRTWNPVWVIEAQFYADSTYKNKLGGATKSVNYSLEKGTYTQFQIKFTPTNFSVSSYPHMAMKARVVQQ